MLSLSSHNILTRYAFFVSPLHFQQPAPDDSHETKEDKSKSNPSKQRDSPHRLSPTLAELNTNPPRAKRPAFSASYSPPPHTLSSNLPYSSAVSDTSSSGQPLPRIAFADKDGLDELSSSFRSLYKSIFGQPLVGGEYLNADVLPDLPVSSSHELGSSDSSSIPLGASASMLLNLPKCNHPQFLSLMDSFRDIADSKSWDKLDPAHVQGLLESFKAGQNDKFGLDPSTYADVHASFNQFLSQLNNRFLTGSSSGMPHLSEYDQPIEGEIHQHTSQLMDHHNKYGSHQHYQIDAGVVSPIPLIGMNHTSPTNSYHPVNRTPSPHHMHLINQGHLQPLGGAGHSHLNSHYGQYSSHTGHTPTLNSLAQSTHSNNAGIKSAVTDLFDDDDFDWSKLM